MKRVLLAILLLPVVLQVTSCGSFGGRPESDCRTIALSAQDHARIRRAAKAVVETALDPKTVSMCRFRTNDWFNVMIETIGVPQADGSERWKSLVCTSDYLRNAPWRCELSGEARGIRVAVESNACPVRVYIPEEIDTGLARQHVLQGFSLLEQSGETAYCEYVEGMKTLPEMGLGGIDGPKAFASMREGLRDGDGELSLALDPDGFALSRFPLNVHYVFGPAPNAAPRVRCWSETVILVTS